LNRIEGKKENDRKRGGIFIALRLKCRRISKGYAEGLALVSNMPISFFGMVDPKTGVVIDRSHDLYGKSLSGRILVFPYGRGSTVGSYVLYGLAKNKKAPAAIICLEAEPIVAVGAIMAGIPMVDRPECFEFRNMQRIAVNADDAEILVY
jgi:predicted aconitase with swiveling domain